MSRAWLPWALAALVLGGCDETATAARDASLDAAEVSDVVRGFDLTWRPADECVLARPADSFDASAPCVPGRLEPCACDDGARGARMCRIDATWAWCRCDPVDAGRPDVSDATPPPLDLPRLIAPQSGSRTTTQRPTLRWVAPPLTARSRVRLCDDRPCTRVLVTHETAETTWRPETVLRPGPVFWRVQALDVGGSVRWTSATWVFGSPRRDTAVDTSYGVLRDTNGDGYDDLVVLVGGGETPVGSLLLAPPTVQVYFGGRDGLTSSRVQVLRPAEAGGYFGRYAVGDVNGDGLMDLAVGDASAPLDGTVPFLPRVFVYLGTRSNAGCGLTRHGVSFPVEWPLLRSGPGDAEAASSLSIGDYDGDGFGDLILSTWRQGGVIQLHRGSPSGLVQAPTDLSPLYAENAHFVGDLNGDGYADILAQNTGFDRSNADPIYALYGNPGAQLDGFVQPIAPPCKAICWEFGHTARGSDLDGDGYSDALVSSQSVTWVYPGSRGGLRPPYKLDERPAHSGAGDTPRLSFGGHISMPGDLDGDGHLEFAIGAMQAPVLGQGSNNPRGVTGPGQVFIFRSAPEGVTPAPWLVISSEAGTRDAGRVSSFGDYDADGYDDFTIGVSILPEFDLGVGRRRQFVRVYRGRSGFNGGPPQTTFDVLGEFTNIVYME